MLDHELQVICIGPVHAGLNRDADMRGTCCIIRQRISFVKQFFRSGIIIFVLAS